MHKTKISELTEFIYHGKQATGKSVIYVVCWIMKNVVEKKHGREIGSIERVGFMSGPRKRVSVLG